MIDSSLPSVVDTTKRQGRASSPTSSVWVSANAGSGKTHVLTQRVIRLLIGGVRPGEEGADPSKIVCITYTKAAAAEMESRLFKRLSDWALADDATLREAVSGLLGQQLSDEKLSEVRQLFARALETPGGLKIQTIHSFCENILRRFPVEAGLLPGFSVMDDGEDARVRREILKDLATAAWGEDEDLRHAFDLIYDRMGQDDARDKALFKLIDQAHVIEEAVRNAGGEDAFDLALRAGIGVPETGGPADWCEVALSRIDRSFLRSLERAKVDLSGKHLERAEAAMLILEPGPMSPTDVFAHVASIWLNKDFARPKPFKTNAKLRGYIPDFEHLSEAFLDEICRVIDQERAFAAYEVTAAMHFLSRRVFEKYVAHKTQHGALDYNDLIEKSVQVLKTTSGAWVLYKLDQGIDHILLDEAQDTGALQWSVIEKFRDEFFDQEPGDHPRTMFVVGDKKQSIYSFQGADADLFDAKKEEMSRAIQSPYHYDPIPLYLSFRSASVILETVDVIFEGEAGQGVHGGEDIKHDTAKPKAYGAVELWPLVPRPESEQGNPWDVPVDTPAPNHPTRQLANLICHRIRKWLDTEEILEAKGRPIEPKDILILCQKRGPQFHEILRALALHNIPMAGADRIALKDDVAVQDMLSLLRFATNHYDDLSLAEVLKSPLWGITEDELFDLAHGRDGRSLWSSVLAHSRHETPLAQKCRQIVQDIERAETVGARSGPFAFFSSYLECGERSGLYRFRQRLGHASDEAIDELMNEALQFELREPRNLQGFLAHLEQLDADVKKEAAADLNAVRIMTVHGAKGLEAPIVFLADCQSAPKKLGDPVFPLCQKSPGGEVSPIPGALVCAPGGVKNDSEALSISRHAALTREREEYRRKLYVAATRAEERLILCGVSDRKTSESGERKSAFDGLDDPMKATWFDLAEAGLQRLSAPIQSIPVEWAEGQSISLIEKGERKGRRAQKAEAPKTKIATCPDWVFHPIETEREALVQFPSSETDEFDQSDLGPVFAPRPPSADKGLSPTERGTLIHLLLEYLPVLTPDLWAEKGADMIARRAAHLPKDAQLALLGEAITVLQDAKFADVFSNDAKAEVPIQGIVNGKRYSGQIDRLLIRDDEILLVDYKTHRPPPVSADQLSASIKNQMRIYADLLRQLYPGRPIRAAILWTYSPSLMTLPEEMLKH